MSVGIIGGGVVGAAHANVFRQYVDVKVYDTEPRKASHSFRDTVQQDVLFLCLPTPMRKDGTVDSRGILDAVASIRSESQAKVVVLKSTLPPNDLLECDRLASGGPSFVFSPEFLTERTAEYDLQQSSSFIFGENSMSMAAAGAIEGLFDLRWPGVPRYWTSLQTASLVKYMRNVFFASKVALLNEFDALLKSFGAERREAMRLFMLDPRIGRSHFQVPGHDGLPGFGGSCFLKDVNGFRHIAREQKVAVRMVDAAWQANVAMRGAETIAEELQKLIGRAASEPITAGEVEKL
jgi:nucleotide sugar dehydrogenase